MTTPTVFIPITSGIAKKNIVTCGVLDNILSAGIRCVIFVPQAALNDFKQAFRNHPRAVIEPLPVLPKLKAKLLTWRYFETFSSSSTTTVKTQSISIRHEKLRRERPLYYHAVVLLSRLSNIKPLNNAARALEDIYFPAKNLDALITKYQPAALFSTDLFEISELPLLDYFHKHKFPIISALLSWDHLTTRGRMPVVPDKLLVWNIILKNEAAHIHGVPRERIVVTGNPNFDFYTHATLPPRDAFLKQINADPAKKLIVYMTEPQTITDREDENVEMILDAIDKRKIKAPAQLLLRPHPKDDFKQYDRFRKHPAFIFQTPSRREPNVIDRWLPNRTDLELLASTLKHADVVVNCASTVSIEAAIFDTPVIDIAFDGYHAKPYHESVRRLYDYNHNMNIIKTGGVRVVHDVSDLIKAINAYLNSRAQDSMGRARIVKEQAWRLDDKAAQRISRAVVNFVKLHEPTTHQ